MIALAGLGGIGFFSVLAYNLIRNISNNSYKFNSDDYKINSYGKVMANVLIIGSNNEKRNKLIDNIKNNYDSVGEKIADSFDIGPDGSNHDWGGNIFRVYDNNNFKFYANKNLNMAIQNNGSLKIFELQKKWQECKEFVKVKTWNILSIDSNDPKLDNYIKNCFFLIYLPDASYKTRTSEMNQIIKSLDKFNKNLGGNIHCKTITVIDIKQKAYISGKLNPDEGFIWDINNHKFSENRLN